MQYLYEGNLTKVRLKTYCFLLEKLNKIFFVFSPHNIDVYMLFICIYIIIILIRYFYIYLISQRELKGMES